MVNTFKDHIPTFVKAGFVPMAKQLKPPMTMAMLLSFITIKVYRKALVIPCIMMMD